MSPPDPDDIAKQAREHAWHWFALHGAQRMQAFNFFVVATAFLIAAYASLLEKHPGAALILALVGAWLAFWFNRLEARSRQLVKAGERALAVSQARLASLAENPDFKILDAVEKTAPGGSSFRRVINVIQWTIFTLFLLGAAYATWLAINRPTGLGSSRAAEYASAPWLAARPRVQCTCERTVRQRQVAFLHRRSVLESDRRLDGSAEWA